jgi:hypothetical protein
MLGASGGSAAPVSRKQALSVPAVMRGRNFICAIATLPLREYDESNRQVVSPLLSQIDPDVADVVTLAQTVEDLIMESISWWLITAQDFGAGFPIAARHLDPAKVSLQPPVRSERPSPLPSGRDPRDAVVWVDQQPVSASRIIRFDSPNPPLLIDGARPIRRALALDRAANMYAEDPRPLDYFKPADGADPVQNDDDIKAVLAKWRRARQTRSTAYVPASLVYETVDSPSPRELQLAELQRQVTLDLANAMGLDPEDLGVSTTSRTYRNDVDRRQNQLNSTLKPYMDAITGRLSMGDVTPPGNTVRAYTGEFLQPNPVDRWTVYETGLRMRAITVPEIREAEGLAPLPADADFGTDPAPPSSAPDGAVGDVQVDAARLSSPATRTFSNAPTFTLDLPIVQLSVDRERRIIQGFALPYGVIGIKDGIHYRFAQDSLEWSDPTRVKLLYPKHDSPAVGHADVVQNMGGRLFTRFKVGRGALGDEALMSAEDHVADGFSVGVDFDPATDAKVSTAGGPLLFDVQRGQLRHVVLTHEPVFDDARVTHVAASRSNGGSMECSLCGHAHAAGVPCPTPAATPAAPGAAPAAATPPPPPATPPAGAAMASGGNYTLDLRTPGPEQTFTIDQVRAMMSLANLNGLGPAPVAAPGAGPGTSAGAPGSGPGAPAGARQTVDPTRTIRLDRVDEPQPYRFLRGTRNFMPGERFVFSQDLLSMSRASDLYGTETDAGRRVMALLSHEWSGGLRRAEFVITTDIDELNPTIQRPDLFVDQQDFRYPIWNSINKGAPPDGVNPFLFPKFSSASGLVADHVEGTEPTGGTYVTTSQTVTPTPVSGKAHLTREIWDMGGNPAVSTLVFNQMTRGYREGLESAAATFLNTLTAAVDINLGVAATDAAFVSSWEAAVAALNFIRGYDLSTMVVDQTTYLKGAGARDTTGRAFWPQLNPMNANGTSASRFTTMNAGGVIWLPSWALPSTPGSPNNSWLYDPMFVSGWATPPQRLEFPGATQAGAYAPVAFVDLAIWGYKALANSDIAAVRQVIYDSV